MSFFKKHKGPPFAFCLDPGAYKREGAYKWGGAYRWGFTVYPKFYNFFSFFLQVLAEWLPFFSCACWLIANIFRVYVYVYGYFKKQHYKNKHDQQDWNLLDKLYSIRLKFAKRQFTHYIYSVNHWKEKTQTLKAVAKLLASSMGFFLLWPTAS